MSLVIHVDGGSRGNPGPAGAGVVIRVEEGELVHEAGYFLGTQTNNAAEYHALLRGLRRAGRCPVQPLRIVSDSELLVRQITGEYQVKSPKLAQLFREAQLLLLKIACWNIQHVKRELNARADELANLAMDQGRDVIVFDRDEPHVVTDAVTPPPIAAINVDAPPKESRRAQAAGPDERIVRVSVSTSPNPAVCPGRPLLHESFEVEHTMPGGVCVHAAHALLPTILAIQNTEPQEFSAVPTLTVRCGRSGCNATFQVAPRRSQNGKHA